MAGLWNRIENVWSNEMLTSAEAQSSARVAVEDARTDMAQGLVRIVNDPEVRAALRETAIQLGASEVPIIAAAEQMGALQGEPESLGVSEWLNGLASETQYEIGRSQDGYHFRQYVLSRPGYEMGDEQATMRSDWSPAYPTPDVAEAAAQAAMGEWAKSDRTEQERFAREEAEGNAATVAEQNGVLEDVFVREWGLGARDAVVAEAKERYQARVAELGYDETAGEEAEEQRQSAGVGVGV